MTLEEMERAVKAFELCRRSHGQLPMDEGFRMVGLTVDHLRCVILLLNDGQFYILLELRRAHERLLRAYEYLDVRTEYLKDELEKQLESINVLLSKMEKEEHLRRDRAVLVSAGSG